VIPAGRRIEDAALLTGCGRFGDDLPVRADTLQAAILRSPHPHAEIRSIDASAALALPGVAGILTGEDALRWTRPFAVAVKAAVEHRCLATDRVRYVGESVAVALARDRHTAEDALERIAVEYRSLPAIVDSERGGCRPMRRYCTRRTAATSSATGGFARRSRGDVRRGAAPHRRFGPLSTQRRNPDRGVVVIAEYLPGEEGVEAFHAKRKPCSGNINR
jgi:2-furoyl-CoA dehydrogenase large subunit